MLFRKNVWEHGTQTTATIERVTVTNTDNGGENSSATHQRVWLTFQYVDAAGTLIAHESKQWVGIGSVPPPGAIVDVAYIGDRIEYRNVRPPDPATPRGWSAGIFSVEDWGTKRATALLGGRGDFEKQRELFQTGVRATATVLDFKRGMWSRRNMHHWTLTLQVDEQVFEVKAWAPSSCIPGPGELIEIAVSPDGRDVALDSDERFDGPPAQALVFRRA